MLGIAKKLLRSSPGNLLTNHSFVRNAMRGGVPGCNLPWVKGMDSPMRFTAFFFLTGVIAFGAPWLLFLHIMLRPYDYVVDD